jgi:hypothetical protein
MFITIQDTMPRRSPGSLSGQSYADILSFILKRNGMPASDAELPADVLLLDLILFSGSPPQ